MHPPSSLIYPLARYEMMLFPNLASPSFKLPSFAEYMRYIEYLARAGSAQAQKEGMLCVCLSSVGSFAVGDA
jgi:hypothetical protein